MPNRFASGKYAISQCDRCGFRYKLKELRRLVIKTKNVNILVCPTCWEPDQPQLQLGMYPVDDPQALRNPRPDTTYYQAGLNPNGNPSDGSRVIQWGWNPVGLDNPLGLSGLPNTLLATGSVGTVTVGITRTPVGIWNVSRWNTVVWGLTGSPNGVSANGSIGDVTVITNTAGTWDDSEWDETIWG